MDKKILDIIQKDAESELRIIIKNKSTSCDTILNSEQLKSTVPSFDKYEMLQNNPPIICCAAYLGAEKCFSALIDFGANIECTDFFHTPLTFFAVVGNSTKILDMLLNLSKNSNHNLSFQYSIFCALEYRCFDSSKANDYALAGWLYSYNFFKSNDNDLRGFSLIKCAIEFNRLDFLRFFVEVANCQLNNTNSLFTKSQNNSFSPLCYAFQKKSFDCLNYLLDVSLSKNQYSRSFTALPTVSNNKISQKSLIIDINQTDEYLNTPIHYAAQYGDIKIVQKILDFDGIIVSVKNSQGKTPLDLAQNQEIALLINQQAEKNKKNEEKHQNELMKMQKERLKKIEEKETHSQVVIGQNGKKIVGNQILGKNNSTTCLLI